MRAKRGHPKYLKFTIFAALTLILLVLLGSYVQWGELLECLKNAKATPLLVAFLLTLLFPILNTTRWLSIIRTGKEKVSFTKAFKVTMACWPLGTLTPGKAGDLVKAVALKDRSFSVGTVVAERLIDIFVLGTFGLLFGIVYQAWYGAILGAAGVFGSLVLYMLAWNLPLSLLPKKIAIKLVAFRTVFPGLCRHPKLFVCAFLSSALNWFLSIAQLHYLLLAFGSSVDIAYLCAILPGATFIGLLPLTIAGAGTRDAALLFLSQNIIPQASLFAASIVYTFLGYFFLGLIGLPFMRIFFEQEKQQPESTTR